MDAIWNLTPIEFSSLILGARLRRVDEKHYLIEEEVIKGKMQATDKKGKPKYSMRQIFDYKKEIKSVYKDFKEEARVDPELVQRFASNKERAEKMINSRFNFGSTPREEEN